MRINKTTLSDLYVITPEVLSDTRGFFMEIFHTEKFLAAGINPVFVQVNESCSKKNVVRGLHLQWDKPLGKLMRVSRGSAFVVAVDIRKKSPTFGKWFGKTCDSDSGEMIFAPFGFATGFCALQDDTRMEYFYTAVYNSRGETSICFDDPAIGIKWPTNSPMLSLRDKQALSFSEWLKKDESNLF